MLGYRFWMQRFHGDPDVLGRTVVRGKRPSNVIGVRAADTNIPDLNYSQCAVWMPTGRDANVFAVIGRTRPGVSPTQISEQIQRVIAAPDWRPTVVPLLDTYVGKVRGWMLLALGAIGLVVLIACVNAANIMLARSFRRAHELAIRSSLGASRRQIALSLMTEGLVLSLVASVCARLFSVWGISAARTAVTTLRVGIVRASTIALNGRLLGAAIVTRGLLRAASQRHADVRRSVRAHVAIAGGDGAVVTDVLAPLAPIAIGPYIHAADEAVQRITATRRFNAGLMSAFGLIAMLIGAAGIYGVRVALGATPRLIRRTVLALTGRHMLAGLAIWPAHGLMDLAWLCGLPVSSDAG